MRATRVRTRENESTYHACRRCIDNTSLVHRQYCNNESRALHQRIGNASYYMCTQNNLTLFFSLSGSSLFAFSSRASTTPMPVVPASPCHMQLFVKNTFLQFTIDRFEINPPNRKRSTSAPPNVIFSNDAPSPRSTNAKPRKHGQSMKIDDGAVLDEFASLARAECWPMMAQKMIERQKRITESWEHLKTKLLESAPRKKKQKKRFAVTKRQFFNAVPWVDPVTLLRARANKSIRPNGEDVMEFWASDVELVTESITSLFSIFVHFVDLTKQRQVMLVLPCGTTIVVPFQRKMYMDNLIAKIKAESPKLFHGQRLICLGQELKGSNVLGDFDVQPGDVISVIFK